MNTKIKFGFRNENQAPLFMIWKEFYINSNLDYAQHVFSFGYPKSFKQYRKQRKINFKKILEFLANCILVFAAGGFMIYGIITHL